MSRVDPQSLETPFGVEADGARVGVVVLAAGLPGRRAVPLARSLGVPVALLPIDGTQSVLAGWLDGLAAAGLATPPVVVLADGAEQGMFEHAVRDREVQFWIGGDESHHRGSAGILADAFAGAFSGRSERPSGVVVIEASRAPSTALIQAIRPGGLDAWVAVSGSGEPLGLSYLPSKFLENVPGVGYFDMKEQLLPLLHRLGFGAHPKVVHGDFGDCRTRESYLEMVRRSLRDGAPSISSSARCAPSSRVEGASIVGAGASVEAEALVVDSVVLPGASIGAQSVVARSVVAPGATVAAGSLIVDAVMDEFADSMRRAG